MGFDGDFSSFATVRVLSQTGREIARGTINYGAKELQKIIGRKTEDFADILQGQIHDTVIHRDNMVLMA